MPVIAPTLTICGISELPDQRDRKVTHVISILDPEHPEIETFQTYGDHKRATLRFHDIIAAAPGQLTPTAAHVESVLQFGEDMQGEPDNGRHLLVHCHMGVSRSTATMLSIMAQAEPEASAELLFTRLVGIRPQAWPNSQMIGFADKLLDRDGELVEALRRHYGRQLQAIPDYRKWMAELGRGAEVEMAILS